MQRFKEILRRLLFPGAAVVLFSVPVAAALLAYTFLAAGEESPVAYIAYVFSAYALTIVCANLVPLVRRAMIGSTGGAVCVLVTVMGLYMVIHAARRIRKLRADSGPSQDK